MPNNLENEIRSKLPHTMELSAGCEIKTMFDKIIKIDCNYIVQTNGDISHKHYDSLGVIKEFYKVIGHPITLPNVLEWLKLLDERAIYAISCEGDIFNLDFEIIAKWDLSKNLLREQSTELIDSLFNLIEKR